MTTDDKARLRDLLANNNASLAYIRTAVSFAGLGFAVAKFGLNPKTMHRKPRMRRNSYDLRADSSVRRRTDGGPGRPKITRKSAAICALASASTYYGL